MIICNMYTLEITWLIGVQLAFLVSKSYDTGPYDYANPVTSGSESSFGRGKVWTLEQVTILMLDSGQFDLEYS